MMAPIIHSAESLPGALADELDSLMTTLAHDLEVCRTLRTAREQLRIISWNRFKARHEHADKVAMLTRRHKGHRSIKEGRVHA